MTPPRRNVVARTSIVAATRTTHNAKRGFATRIGVAWPASSDFPVSGRVAFYRTGHRPPGRGCPTSHEEERRHPGGAQDGAGLASVKPARRQRSVAQQPPKDLPVQAEQAEAIAEELIQRLVVALVVVARSLAGGRQAEARR